MVGQWAFPGAQPAINGSDEQIAQRQEDYKWQNSKLFFSRA
jgi:hypothetical protein